MLHTFTLDDLVSIFLSHPDFKGRPLYHKMLGDDPEAPVLVDCGAWKQYVSRNDDAIGRTIVEHKAYEPHVTAALNNVLAPGMVFVDIGANIGYFSLLAARKVGARGRVIAFEPSQRNCALLQMSATVNQLPNIELYPLAVADKDTTLVYNRLVGSNGVTSQEIQPDVRTDDLAHQNLVRAVRLDNILRTVPRIDVIKLDIEGAEYRALRGGERLLRKHRPIIFSEFSPGWLPQISAVSPRTYLLLIAKHDYSLSIIETGGNIVECGQDIDQVLRYFEEHAFDHIDIMAVPRRRKGRLRQLAELGLRALLTRVRH